MKIKSYGQFAQDFFVARLLGFKTGGFFVDIGCGTSHLDLRYSHFASMSNTYLLEQTFKWKGVALDYDKNYCDIASKQRNSVHCVDLMEHNINDVLDAKGCPEHFDYLSFDVDEAQRKVLDEFDFDKYSFDILTYEHNYSVELSNPDSIYCGDKDYSREKFEKLGYKILFGNVGLSDTEHIEDWYVSDRLFEQFGHLAQDFSTLTEIYNKIK